MIAKAKEINVNYISLKLVAYIGTVHLSIQIPRDESIRFVEQHGGDVHVISNPQAMVLLAAALPKHGPCRGPGKASNTDLFETS